MLCIKCGRSNPKGVCERRDCPYRLLYSSLKKVQVEGKEEFMGKSPNVFVGHKGYPRVRAGFLTGEFVDEAHDSPKEWAEKSYTIPNIVELRSTLINSRYITHVKSFSERLSEKMNVMAREVAMAKQAVDVEVKLEKRPRFTLSLSQDIAPYGPSIALKNARITENVKIPNVVERAVDATDLKATDAMRSLTKSLDEHALTKLISVGALGVKTERKLVPTRWSITAVDDTLGKQMIAQIKAFQPADYQAFFGSYLGNYYLILFFPEVWSYELFETTLSIGSPMTDYEPYAGRKEYASETVGGYYAARLAILEQLVRMKRQASVLALRFISDEYYVPLGVWVVRSAARKAMLSSPIKFSSAEEMLAYAKGFIKKSFSYDVSRILDSSILLSERRSQRKLHSFF
ncbi:MAG: hypothetical protein ABIJ21_04970 [Nanoarchaeota archaeon]